MRICLKLVYCHETVRTFAGFLCLGCNYFMEQFFSLNKQSITSRFLFEKYDSATCNIVKNFDYSIQIQIARGRPYGFNSIRFIKLERKSLDFQANALNSVWTNLGKRTKILEDSFASKKLVFPTQDVGKSLSLLAILALKLRNDFLKDRETNGLLFRSDIYSLRKLGIWKHAIELDSLASDINRSSKAIKPVERRYKKMPLVFDFLLDGNEIYNLICWAGSNKKNTVTNCYDEKVWFLNTDVSNIEIIDERDIKYGEGELHDILEYFFPEKAVLTSHELHLYKKILPKKNLFFKVVDSSSENFGTISNTEHPSRIVDLDYLKNYEKYIQQDKVLFNSIFKDYSKKFIKQRDTPLSKLRSLVSKTKKPFIFLLGNMGCGKSIIIIQFILKVKNDPIYFFVNSERDYSNPLIIIKHIIVSLLEKYRFDFIELPDKFDALIEILNSVLARVSKKLYDIYHRHEVIILDGLEQIFHMSPFKKEMIQFLSSVTLPENIKIIISSRYSNLFKEYIADDYSNVLIMGKRDPEQVNDLQDYCQKRLDYDVNSDRQILTKSDGNFRYAYYTMNKMFEKNVKVWQIQNEDQIELNKEYEFEILQMVKFVRDNRSIEYLFLLSFYTSYMGKGEEIDFEFLRRVLNIKDEEIDLVLQPVVQFFDISLLLSCNQFQFFHPSFASYINATKIEIALRTFAIDKLMKHVFDSAERYNFESVPKDIFHFLPLQIGKIYSEEKMLDYFREKFIPLFFRDERLVLDQISPVFLMYCTLAATVKKLPTHMIFFYLIANAKHHYYHGKKFSIEEKCKFHETKHENLKKLMKTIGARKSGKSIYQKTIDAYIGGKMSGFDVETLFSYGFLFISKSFDNYDNILELCNKYSKTWTKGLNTQTEIL